MFVLIGKYIHNVHTNYFNTHENPGYTPYLTKMAMAIYFLTLFSVCSTRTPALSCDLECMLREYGAIVLIVLQCDSYTGIL